MIPKLAIEKAVAGGWQNPVHLVSDADEKGRIVVLSGYPERVAVVWKHAEIALDPSFWQSLIKATGWQRPWERYAHDFFDIILTGGDTEKFWDDLLK